MAADVSGFIVADDISSAKSSDLAGAEGNLQIAFVSFYIAI
jgi:hypothetical protein